MVHVVMDTTQPPDAAIDELPPRRTRRDWYRSKTEPWRFNLFLRKALTRALDRTDLQEICNMMQLEIDMAESRATGRVQGV
jgi:hypothetical protein